MKINQGFVGGILRGNQNNVKKKMFKSHFFVSEAGDNTCPVNKNRMLLNGNEDQRSQNQTEQLARIAPNRGTLPAH